MFVFFLNESMCTLQRVMITSLETFVRRTAVQERVKRSRASFFSGRGEFICFCLSQISAKLLAV